jgi:hypothetical protein
VTDWIIQTNNLSLHRVLGTMCVVPLWTADWEDLTSRLVRFGAATAAGIYSLFPDNAVVLSIFGFFFSIPCFYYIVSFPQYATTGRFVLLTYNLTCLFSLVSILVPLDFSPDVSLQL